jgi:hypothetical protein
VHVGADAVQGQGLKPPWRSQFCAALTLTEQPVPTRRWLEVVERHDIPRRRNMASGNLSACAASEDGAAPQWTCG